MGTTDTLRAVIDAGRVAQRLDELSTARVIGKIAEQIHQAQQRAGTGKAVGPITPAGIVIDSAGIAKLGLAEPMAFAYGAPEQAAGGEGDRRSDVFSLGTIMWEALTHRPLFEAESDAATKTAVAEREVKSPSELNANVPAELGAICLKALARNPADRYQSAKVMAAEIEAVLEQAGYVDNDEKIAAYMVKHGKAATPAAAGTRGTAAARAPASSSPPPRIEIPHVVPRPSAPAHAATQSRSASTASVSPPNVAPAQDSTSSSGTAPGFAAAASHGTSAAQGSGNALRADSGGSPPTLLGTPPAPATIPAPAPATVPAPAPATIPAPAPAKVPAPAPTIPAPAPATIPAPAPTIPAAAPAPAPSRRGSGSGPSAASGARANQPAQQHAAHRSPDPAAPHPAAAVSLPNPNAREPELLEGWRWRTGAQPVYQPDDAEDEPPQRRNPLPYIIGAGVVAAGVILTIMLAFGSQEKPVHRRTPVVTGSNVDPHSVNSPSDAMAAVPVNRNDAPGAMSGGSAISSAPALDAGTRDAQTIDAAAPHDATARDAKGTEAQGSQTPTSNSKVPEAKATEAKVPEAKAPEAKATDAKAPTAEKTNVKAPAEATETTVNSKETATKSVQQKPPTHEASAKREEKSESKPASKSTKHAQTDTPAKSNAELPYRQGVQQFMRGDTSGAVRSLRAALATNPNYAPAWRALGLVFEKTGDSDQARTAFKRYLQLAPSANDVPQIRNRLEKLGL